MFAPSGPGAAEDDGYRLAFVHNPGRGAADLVVPAVQDFTAEPVARLTCPRGSARFPRQLDPRPLSVTAD